MLSGVAHNAPRRPATRAARGLELFLFEEEPGGWPAPLSEVAGWQERVERHTAEHIVDICPFVQIFDVLVPQTGEQVVNFFRFLDAQSPVEQVTDVPKNSEDRIQQRFVERDSRIPQMAEQLVEVPTVLSLFLLAEQIVDILVPRGRGGSGDGGPQGFLPGQGSQRTVEQIVAVPVPGGGLQHFPSGQSSTACSPEELFQGVVRGGRREFECEGARTLELIHAGCSSRCRCFVMTSTTARTTGSDRSGRATGRCRLAFGWAGCALMSRPTTCCCRSLA